MAASLEAGRAGGPPARRLREVGRTMYGSPSRARARAAGPANTRPSTPATAAFTGAAMRLAGGARRATSRQPCARAFLFLLAAAACRRAAGIVGSTAMPLRTGDTGDLGPPVRREACRARAPSPLRLSAA